MTVLVVDFAKRATCDCGWVGRMPDARSNGRGSLWAVRESNVHRKDSSFLHAPIRVAVFGVGLTTALELQEISECAEGTVVQAIETPVWQWLAFRGWGWSLAFDSLASSGPSTAFPIGRRQLLTGDA